MKTHKYSLVGNWSREKARSIYGIGPQTNEFQFLDVSNDGELLLKLMNGSISFKHIVNKLKDMGLSSAIVRIPELIDYQLHKLYTAFNTAISKYSYKNRYQGVFPVKVNQTSTIINAIAEYGLHYDHGWEVGTKPELLIAASKIKSINTLIICNGAKDEEYIEACLVLLKHGYNIIVSIETIHELDILINMSTKYSLVPPIGLRIKIKEQVPGHWGHSSGFNSKFGLSAHDLQQIITRLEQDNLLSAVKLIHGHIGSQVCNKLYFQKATTELIGQYISLQQMGCFNLSYINLGGGLGIDYEGNSYAQNSGTGYTFSEYADTIVETISVVLNKYPEISVPIIITESGRAITAHSSVLLVQILEERRALLPDEVINTYKIQTQILKDFLKSLQFKIIKVNSLVKLHSFIVETRNAIETLENNPNIWCITSVREELEVIYAEFYKMVRSSYQNILINLNKLHATLPTKKLLEQYPLIKEFVNHAQIHLVGNFSVFNGACDAVLANQYFPVLPITNLLDKPESLIKLVDITCDSDGELNKYCSKSGIPSQHWPLDDFFTKDGHLMCYAGDSVLLNGIPFPEAAMHSLNYVAIALTGAYQDTVNFDQNLLGRIPEVSVKVSEMTNELELQIVRFAETSAELIPKMNHTISEIIQKLPFDPIFETILYSSPYLHEEIRLENLPLFALEKTADSTTLTTFSTSISTDDQY